MSRYRLIDLFVHLILRRTVELVMVATLMVFTTPVCAHEIKWEVGKYRIEKKDCLSTISRKLCVSVNALKKFNGLSGNIIQEGKTLRYPEFESSVKLHWVYTSGNFLYLMVYEDEKVESWGAISVLKKEQGWVPIDRFKSPYSLLGNGIKIVVKDLNNDGQDECYAFRTYAASSKDVGVEALFHAPEVSKCLCGIVVNFHTFSIGARETEGYPGSMSREEKIGECSGALFERYKTYIERKATMVLDELTSQRY